MSLLLKERTRYKRNTRMKNKKDRGGAGSKQSGKHLSLENKDSTTMLRSTTDPLAFQETFRHTKANIHSVCVSSTI